MKLPIRIMAVTAAAALTVSLSACGQISEVVSGGGEDTAPTETAEAPADDTAEEAPADDAADSDSAAGDEASTDDAAAEGETAGSDDAAAASGSTPDWAEGSVDAGESIGTMSTDSFDVEVFQVDTGKTEEDSSFVDPDTNENILPKGSEVVYVNFVFTNSSDEPVNLGYSLGTPKLTSSDWEYMQGQPGEAHSDVYEALGLSMSGIAAGGGEAPFVVEPGQSFSQATSIEYKAGETAEAEVGLVPVDEAGELLHDEKQEATTEVTIK